MDGLYAFAVILLGTVISSHAWISGSTSELTVRPGDNITLYCDCKLSNGAYRIVWFRNCSHENQPPLVLKLKRNSVIDSNILNHLPRFHLVRNQSSESYDLLIMNISDSDDGIYYCATEQAKVDDGACIRQVYTYGDVTTRILFNSSTCPEAHDSGRTSNISWMMVFMPALTILTSFISFMLVFHICQETAKDPRGQKRRPDRRHQTRGSQDEDVFLTQVVFRTQDQQRHK